MTRRDIDRGQVRRKQAVGGQGCEQEAVATGQVLETVGPSVVEGVRPQFVERGSGEAKEEEEARTKDGPRALERDVIQERRAWDLWSAQLDSSCREAPCPDRGPRSTRMDD